MGYFDGIVDGAFKKSDSGDTLFYPWGKFGSGFIIKSDEQHEHFRKFYKKMYMVLLPAIIIIQLTVGFWLNAALLLPYGIWYYFISKKMTANLSRTTEKLRFKESYENSAKSHNLATLIILEVLAVAVLAFGVWGILVGSTSTMLIVSTVFFGICGASFGYMIFIKVRSQSGG